MPEGIAYFINLKNQREMALQIKNYAEFKDAEVAWINGLPYKGYKGYDLEKALADFTGGVNRINENCHGQAFERTSFDGKTASATIKKMEVKTRR